MRKGNQNPYLFIVGCPRSGTTLLRRMLDAHSDLAITRETHWIPDFFEKRDGLTPEGRVTRELIPKLLGHSEFSKLGIAREQLEALIKSNEPPSYATFVTGIFDLYGRLQGKRLVGDKTPGYVRKLRTLHTLWPKARFLHLIRDGRDVCLSAISWKKKTASLAKRFPTWSEDPVSTAAVWWKWNVRLGLEAGQEFGPGLYYEMRYESLVADPAGQTKALCKFLSVPYEESMLRFHEGRTKSEDDLDAKHAWLPITPGLRDWRQQMDPEDLQRFEAAAGDLIKELGYSRAILRPEQRAREQASLIYQAFTQDALSRRGRLLPKSW
jgi:sulfotransferase family protein